MNDNNQKPVFTTMGINAYPVFEAVENVLCKMIYHREPITKTPICYAIYDKATQDKRYFMDLEVAKKAFLRTVEPLCNSENNYDILPLP